MLVHCMCLMCRLFQGIWCSISDPGVSFCRITMCSFPLSELVGQCLVKSVPFWCIMFLKTVAG